ncbi:MAG TPA: PEP-CTERM sorting domain-containing protein [Haliangiales bacterium]|nr:PEP-CTERM sorting domain-containing protein [Haliangiales bacterium]
MRRKSARFAGLPVFTILLLTTSRLSGQGLLVDQASGTLGEFVETFTQLPDNQIAQSFTPSLSAVGFVQLSEFVPAFPGNNAVTFAVNLREGAYNGPILSSTTPVVLVNHFTQIGTFFYPANIPVTPGQLYFFEPVLLSAGFLDVGYKAPSSYLGGDAWNNGVPSGGTADYWFREGVVVPEPATIWLLLLGSGVFIWRLRLEKSSWL